jgi:hypothetical protein
MTGKRALASLCAFAFVILAMRAAFHHPSSPTQTVPDSVQLSAPSPALQTAAKALFSNPPDRPSAQNERAAAYTGETLMPRPDSAHPSRRWSAGTSGQAASVGDESSSGPATENSAASFQHGHVGQTAPSWQLPPAGGGRAPIAGGAPQFPRSGRAASPAATRSAGGAMALSTAGAGRAAPAPGKKVVAGAVASSGGRADAGAGPGFDGGLQLPNARPSAGAGARAADSGDSDPVRSMGALSGAPDGGSAPSAAADPSGGDEGGGSAGGSGEGGLAAAQSKAKTAAAAKPDDAGEGPASPAAAAPAPRRHRGHGGAAASSGPADPNAPDAAAPGAAAPGTTAADPATPAASPNGDSADPTDASGRPLHPVAEVKPVIGFPRIPDPQPAGDPFAATPDGPASVQTFVFQTASAKPGFAFKAEMANDRNGRANASTPPTALRYPDGTSLNPDQIPFMTIPKSFADAHPEVKLGDYGAISYGGKTLYTIVGDYGPPGGSRVTWTGLGIDLRPKDGLTGPQVHFTALAGSGDGKIPKNAADVETAAQAAFDAAKVPTR